MAAILSGDVPVLIHDAIIRGLQKGAQTVRNLAILNVTGRVLKRDTGRLATSITAGVTPTAGGGILRVGTQVFYGAAWEHGFYRKQFTIVPKAGKALRFMPKGGTEFIFRRKVTIPAQYFPARPWLRPAAEAALPEVTRLVKAEVDRAFPGRSLNIDIKIA
jgi:phage gpG-like protein